MKPKKSRRPIVAGNWKMNKTVTEAEELVKDLIRDPNAIKTGVDVVLCPPFTALSVVSGMLNGTHIRLGAQNMHWEKSGAFTGEISAEMLRALYCHYVILGHSERRALFGETDEIVNRKIKAALASHLQPVMCVGETLEERESGSMKSVIKRQVENGLAGVDPESFSTIIVAYEPVWAIGTGKAASPADAAAAAEVIKSAAARCVGAAAVETMRVLYGGSVTPANIGSFVALPQIHGALVGGASLEADSFINLIIAAREAVS